LDSRNWHTRCNSAYTSVTAWQVCEIRKQTPRIAESAEAARKALLYNNMAMVISPQASVVVPESFDAKWGTDSNTGKKDWAFIQPVENGGNTPALDVRVCLNENSPEFRKLPKTSSYPDNPPQRQGLFPNMEPSEAGGFDPARPEMRSDP
jgi:hypothetical protein